MDSSRHTVIGMDDSTGISVHSGFPNPATDVNIKNLDLNSLLIWHSASTFMMNIEGNEWSDLGIFSGDVALIDRALKVKQSDKIVWIHNDAFSISHTNELPKQSIVWGVVTAIIHRYRKF